MSTYRSVLEVELTPIAGSLFQPTGFPDLGAAEFRKPSGTDALLVESAQSVANWLESTTWDQARNEPSAPLSALPYLRIVGSDGAFLSSSRLEAHRIASAYVMDGKVDSVDGRDWLLQRLGLIKGRPLDYQTVARACFALDPVSLVHGVFFAQQKWPWQPKIARAVTGFVEATGVRPVVSGGVKKDFVINEAKQGETSRGYGTVPHHRTEYTAERIAAYFTVDHEQFRSYGLSGPATSLLEALADFEIGTLLDHGLRLRTRCDLEVKAVTRGEIPDANESAQRIAKFAADCKDELDPVTTVRWEETARTKSAKTADE